MSNTFVDIDELLETEKNLMRTIYNMSQTVVKLEEEVAQLRQVATDLHREGQDCWGCDLSQSWACAMCKHRKLIDGWEASDV